MSVGGRIGVALAAVLVAASTTALAVAPPPASAAAPAMTVEPSTGLVDGDEVTVTVTGLRDGEWVDAAQCVAAPVDIHRDCDLNDYAYAVADRDGTATLTIRVDAVLATGYPEDGPVRQVDCRTTGCVIGVSVESGATLLMSPLSFDPGGELAPPPALTVTPDADLTDYQMVSVEASGLVWSNHAVLVQCAAPAGELTMTDCDYETVLDLDTSGSDAVTVDYPVSAVIESWGGGAVDCREPGGCVLAVANDGLRSPAKTTSVPLSFVADAEVSSPTLTMSPDADLVDGQQVTVTGEGFRPSAEGDAWIAISLCTSDPSYGTCQWTDSWAPVDATGGFTADVTVWAVVPTVHGEVDCRTSAEPCLLVASLGSPSSPRAGTAALDFAADGPLLPPPSIEVTPSADLVDGAGVSVAGTGFTPDGWATVIVCRKGDLEDLEQCDDETWADVDVSASGTFALDMTVAARFETWLGDPVDCREAPGCAVVAEDGPRRRLASADISFVAPTDPAGGQRYVDPVFDEVEITRDIVYRTTTDAHGDQVGLTLDLHEPAGDTAAKRPVVVWSHGGWFGDGGTGPGGDPDAGADPDSYARELARRGYVVATIDYRTRPELGCCPTDDAVGIAAAIADATADAEAAVAWLREHAGEHRLDPEAVAAAGDDAGGALAYGLAYPGQGRGAPHGMHEAADSPVAAAVAVSGVSLGQPGHGAPPVLAFHGADETTAPAHLSEWTCAAARKAGSRCDVVTYAGSGSGIAWSKQRDIVRRSVGFLAEVMLAPLGYFDADEAPVTTTSTTTTTAPVERGSDPPGAPDEPDGARPAGDLPRTGSDGTGLLVRLGVAAATLGAGLSMLSAWRRRSAGVPGSQGS